MKLVITKNSTTIEPAYTKQILEIRQFDTAQNSLKLTDFTAKGSLLVGTGNGTFEELPVGANGYIPVADSTASGGFTYEQKPTSVASEMTNRSGGTLSAGSVVVINVDYDNAFTTTVVDNSKRVVGVLTAETADQAEGNIQFQGGTCTVLTYGPVKRGQWLVTTTSAGRARAYGYTKPTYGAIGMAVTETSAVGNGNVTAIIAIEMYLGASKGKGVVAGGINAAAAYVATAQTVDYIAETTSLTAGANITSVRGYMASCSSPTDGYYLGGTNNNTNNNQATADKCVFASSTTAAAAGANLSTARADPKGLSGTTTGFILGGSVLGVDYSVIADKLTYAADTTAAAASANLSTKRSQAGAVSCVATHGYYCGGYAGAGALATTDKTTFASDTTAACGTADLPVVGTKWSGLSDITTYGYIIQTVTYMITFAADSIAANSAASLTPGRYYPSGMSGTMTGFAVGGTTDSGGAAANGVTTADRFDFGSKTASAWGPAALLTAVTAAAGTFSLA